MNRRRISPQHRAHAVRVAAAATALVAVVAVVLGAALDLVVSHRLTTQVSQQVSGRLSAALRDSRPGPASTQAPATFASGDEGGRYGLGIYGAPVFVWEVAPDGTVLRATAGAPALPMRSWGSRRLQGSLTLGVTPFLLVSAPAPPRDSATGSVPPDAAADWFVTGESLAELSHVRSVLATSEALALPILVLTVFLGSLAIGIRSVVPVEEARRRQLEFTADASHELRTPLSVIEAELALAAGEPPDGLVHTGALERIGRESARLQRIVEDLLWLARFDSEPPPPGDEPIDLGAIAQGCVDRFAALAAARQVALSLEAPSDRSPAVVAPPEWIDRLAGVLVDNACRHAGKGGSVVVSVGTAGARSVLAVEDSGPGIAEEERGRLFDRFSRVSREPGGHGLGLAIADSVVRSTGGRWRIGRATAGGARMEVSWPQS
jgi:signal transduction histidine kinase